jgi:predicted Zn-dependent peptidase
VADVTIVIASQGPPEAPADTDALPVAMMAAVLNNSASAFQSRLVGSGLLQSVSCLYTGHRHDGTIELRAHVSVDNAPTGMVTLLNEVSVLDAMSGMSEEDLGFARRATAVAAAIDGQEPSGLAEVLAEWWGGPGIAAYNTFDQRLAAVKLTDVTRVAESYVSSKPHVIGILGPRAAIEAIRARLMSGSKGGQQ